MSQILPGLFVGGIEDIVNEARDGTLGVTHVLNVAQEIHGHDHRSSQFQYHHLNIEDDGSWLDVSMLYIAIDFIQKGLESGICMVHCWSGVSRSVCVAVAYLVAHHNMTFDAAIAHVHRCRPQADPWPTYLSQVRMWATDYN
jgi:protein-tyrosine phosphatase